MEHAVYDSMGERWSKSKVRRTTCNPRPAIIHMVRGLILSGLGILLLTSSILLNLTRFDSLTCVRASELRFTEGCVQFDVQYRGKTAVTQPLG